MFERLNPELAEKFIKQIAQYTKFNVNIMDITGRIIASSHEAGREGAFHEIAYRMLQERTEMMLIDEDSEYLGTKKGVNLLLSYGKEALGVVGVTGDPHQVREIALIIKMALETMIAYEEQQYINLYQKSKREQFYAALFEDGENTFGKLELLAEQLKIDSRCIRVPVLFVSPKAKNIDEMIHMLTDENLLSSQDLCWRQDNRHVAVFKKLTGRPEEIFADWEKDINEWLEKALKQAVDIWGYVGTLQCRLQYYKKALEHCQWLERNVQVKNQTVWFLDYLNDYFDSLFPVMEMYALYNVYDRHLDEAFKEMFCSVIGSLRHTNYNLVTSSKELFVHKNTLAFRMNKIKDIFSVNPFSSNQDRIFVDGFYRYLKKKNM